MKRRSDYPINQIQPLPGDFSPAMRELDSQLAENARLTPIPAGLVDRVFEASASLLPEHQSADAVASRWRLIPGIPGVSGRSLSIHRLAWGRVAMAASVMIVCAIAVRFLHHPSGSAPELAEKHKTPAALDVHSNLNWFTDDSTVQLDNDMAYLLDTSDMTSADDLSRDLAVLASNLEL